MFHPVIPKLPSLTNLLTHPQRRTYAQRQFLRIRTLDICRVCISPQHKIPHSSQCILTDPSHVLRPRLHQRYEPILKQRYDEFKEGLWLGFTSNSMQRTKVVRTWARRRVAQAVTEGLRVRGFDGKGRRIEGFGDGGGEEVTKGQSGLDVLVGTVEVEIMNQSVETAFAEVRRQAGLVVEEILRICGRQGRMEKPQARRRVAG